MKSYQIIIDQAARSIRDVIWAARHGLNFDRGMTVRVCCLLTLSFFLQASVAMSLIMASKLMSGEAITIWRFSYEAANRKIAIAMAFGSILVIMLLVAFTNFGTSIYLRRLGRSVHTDALKTIINILDGRSKFDKFDIAKINRILLQASLHLGIAVETIFRMAHPVLIIASATVAITVLDPWLLPIIILLAMPIIPVYLKESRRLIQLSENFFGNSSKNIGKIVSKYVIKSRSQNIIPLREEKCRIINDKKIDQYLNDYDSFVLSNDRMSFITSSYRPLVFCVILIYITFKSYNNIHMGNHASTLPILFAIFYLSNGALGAISFGTKIMRFLPQVRLIRGVLDNDGSDDKPPALVEAKEDDARAPPHCTRRKQPAKASDKDATFLLYVTPALNRENVAKLQDALAECPLDNSFDGREIAFVSSQFSGLELPAKSSLTAGRLELWPEVETLLRRYKLDGILDKLPEGGDTIVTDSIWNALGGEERALFRCLPLLWVSKDKIRTVEYDALNQLDKSLQQHVLRQLRTSPLLVHYGETEVPKSVASRGLILQPEGGYELVSLKAFYEKANALKQQGAATDSTVTGAELLV